MGLINASGIRVDPVLNYNFLISLMDSSSSLIKKLGKAALADVVAGGFNECSGIEMSLEVEEFKEGGNNGRVLKFPTRVNWSNITLKKGHGANTELWDWFYGFVEGRGKRRDGLIMLLTEMRIPHTIWRFRRGLPVKYTGPSMNAGQSNVAIESIEIAHEGVEQDPFIGVGANVVTNILELGT